MITDSAQNQMYTLSKELARKNAVLLEGYKKILSILAMPGNIQKKDIETTILETLDQII